MDEIKQQHRHHRGTRRQQRYKAKQNLMELCELASAQAMELDTEVLPITESSGKVGQRRRTEAKHSSVSLPDYLNVPNRVFRHMLSTASEHVLSYDQMKSMNQWLNVSTNMQQTREQAQRLDRLLYLQQQQCLWADYFHAGSTEEVWASEVQNKMSGQTKSALLFVIDYRQRIIEQLERTQHEVNDHQCDTNTHVSNLLQAFIRKGQHRLTAEFQCKKRLLAFDCQSHRLTRAFFELAPTKRQVRSARMIWSATLKQHMAEERVTMLKHRLAARALPKSLDVLDQSFTELNQDLKQKVIDGNTRTTISGRRQKVIGQMKLDMMAIEIAIAEAAARGHSNRVRREREQLVLQGEASERVIYAVQARQENISRRARYVTSCKVSFFDETPMMPMEPTTGSIIGV